jgi:hypothetical protein
MCEANVSSVSPPPVFWPWIKEFKKNIERRKKRKRKERRKMKGD